jgi:hypothetical protein
MSIFGLSRQITLTAVLLGLVFLLAVGGVIWLQTGHGGSDPDTPKVAGALPKAGGTSVENPDQRSPNQGGQLGQLVPGGQTGDLSEPVPSLVSRLQILVPAYFYPSGPGLKAWQRMMEAAVRVKLVAIANPASGPGDQRNQDYFRVIKEASSKGVTVIGYVSTRYGNRPNDEIQGDMDKWVEFYPQIKGFFLDQQSSSLRDVLLYTRLRDHARKVAPNALIVNNPGTLCDDGYLSERVSDVTCIFTGFEGFNRFTPPGTFKRYSPSRFAAFAYQVRSSQEMRQVFSEAIVKRIGYLYVSDSLKGDNPWAQLPTYWDDEVEAVSQAE